MKIVKKRRNPNIFGVNVAIRIMITNFEDIIKFLSFKPNVKVFQ